VPLLLVGLKADLRQPSTSDTPTCLISQAEAEAVAESIGAYGYYECSAKNHQGIVELFDEAARASMVMQREGERNTAGCVVC
jgi:Ras family protein A